MDKSIRILIFVGICIISSGCASTSTTSSSPDKVVDGYIGNLIGFSMDSSSAYQVLSEEVRSNISSTDFETEMSNLKSYSVPSYELEDTEIVEQSNTTANVSATIRADAGRGTYTETLYVPMIKTEGEWKINKRLNPFV